MNTNYLFRLMVLMLLTLMPITVLRAQDDYLFEKINTRLKEGNCESAQRLYNSYKQSTNRTDSDIERRIAACKDGEAGYTAAVSGRDQTFTVGGVSFKMVYVDGGTFNMGAQKSSSGSANYDPEAQGNESPVHSVTVGDYYIGETEVTQALWKAVMGSNPSRFKGDSLPVENVSWEDICGKDGKGTDPNCFLYKLRQKTGRNFRLSTEAEWEHAARGGESTSLYNGENIRIKGDHNAPNLDPLAWYCGNCGQNYTSSEGCDVSNGYYISGWNEKQYNDSEGGTHPVGKKRPNAYGLYDMLGNVREWCSDWYGGSYYGSSPQGNPQGPSSGSHRVLRGGSWYSYARNCRVSYRSFATPWYRNYDSGFRLALSR